ncbi:hypothetical protein [Micromonospora zamorensis]|uniref:hypothetical protein n=1 Tax=Micromonospora zamorensis TaxID=709883 RepID=UPI0033D5D28E
MLIHFPISAPLTESTAKFIAVANVLAGVERYASNCGEAGYTLLESEARQVAATPVNGARELSSRVISRLRIAWQTELAARVGDALDDPVLRRVAAQTLPVQAYYAVFNAARAMTLVGGAPVDTHAAVQKDFESQRARRSAGPWRLTLSGDPKFPDKCLLDPGVCKVSGFNLLESGHEAAEYVAAGLRMTRKWKIESARDEWLKRNRKKDGSRYQNLPAAGRVDILSSLRRTTLMDFLYEMRRRTNYESVDEYGSDATDAEVHRFHVGLLYATRSGLLLYETQIAQYAGIKALAEAAADWSRSVKRAGKWATEAVEERLNAIEGALR